VVFMKLFPSVEARVRAPTFHTIGIEDIAQERTTLKHLDLVYRKGLVVIAQWENNCISLSVVGKEISGVDHARTNSNEEKQYAK